MVKGTVKWFNNDKGVGFIQAPEAEKNDIFVHFSDVEGDGYRKLRSGQVVTFSLFNGPRGYFAKQVAVVEA